MSNKKRKDLRETIVADLQRLKHDARNKIRQEVSFKCNILDDDIDFLIDYYKNEVIND